MDVVIRTPHGEAEITIARAGDETAIADVVELVTGSASPPTADVDGRAVLTSVTISRSGVVTGSVIDLGSPAREPSPDSVVELVQVAGWGAGARHALGPGTYRVGPGRRVNAADLDVAPVDSTAFELAVDSDGGATVTAGELPVRIDGAVVEAATPWTDGILDVAGRAFQLDRDPAPADPRGGAALGDRSGTMVFNRPPRPGRAPVPPPITVAGDERAAGATWRSSRPRRRPHGSARPTGGWQDMLRGDVTARRRAERRRRLDLHPHVAAAVRMATEVAPRLWSARPGDDVAYELAIGLGDVEWTPALSYGDRPPAEPDAIVAEFGPLPMVPVTVDLGDERGIAFVGSTEFGRAAARGLLVEACVQHGPADLDVVVLTDPDRAPVWEWVKWLPHSRTSGVAHVLVALDQVDGWVASIRHGRRTASNHLTLAVVDEPAWWRERAAPVRGVMSDASSPVRFVALASGEHDIPAVCTTLVHEQPDDLVRVERLAERTDVEGVHAFLLSTSVAAATARGLAPFDDPDLAVPAASTLAASVPIRKLLGPANLAAATIAARWRATSARSSARVPIGVTHRDMVEVDLERDGPHLLIGGADGAGKSELLRTIVVGLATGLPPDAITFALLDLEGTSTFAAVASLPHVVMHHDVADAHLAERSVRCLRAELLARDESARHGQAPPRLVIVVDEPSAGSNHTRIVSELLEIATGGERLGVHLVLATRHPSAILADPNAPPIGIRVALSLADERDSTAMIGARDAAGVPRRTPGRGWLRVGTGDPVELQAATVSISHGPDGHHDLELRPYVVGRELSPMELRVKRGANGDARRALSDGSAGSSGSDLAQLVAEITSAAATVDQSRPRSLCPGPLPDLVDARRLDTGLAGNGVPYALVDLPDQQCQQIRWWEPGRGGSLLIHGTDGAGTSSLVESLAIGAAERYSADDLHLYVIDSGARAPRGALAPLAALPHTGAVVRFDDLPRVHQLVRLVVAEIIDRTATIESAMRRALPSVTAHDTLLPHIVVMIDDVGALHQILHEAAASEHMWADIVRIARDGPAVGVCIVVTAKRPDDVPAALAAQIPSRLVMRLADAADYASFGLRPVDIPAFVPGRALDPTERAEMQVVIPAASMSDAISALAAAPARFRPSVAVEPDPQ